MAMGAPARPRTVASARDVARRAGVSLTTVSNTLNRPEVVAEATRRRVLTVVSDLGFVPNGVARLVSTGTSRSVGLIVPDLSTASVGIARGVQEELHQHGRVVLMANSYGDVEREKHHLRAFVETRVAGVIVVTGETDDGSDRGFGPAPAVIVSGTGEQHRGASVRWDAGSAGGVAAAHLLVTGRTRLAFVGASMCEPRVRRGFEDASRVVAASPSARLDYLPTQGSLIADGRSAAMTIRQRGVGFYDGVIAASDQLAIGILQALHSAPGFRVPADLAVIGTSGDALADATTPPLTTVTLPGVEMGRAAVRLLMSRRSPADDLPESTRFDPQLVVRGSSARQIS